MNSFVPHFVRACRSLALLLFGGLMVGLATSGRLWQYLNPDFSPLIVGTGVVLLLTGCLAVFAPVGDRPWRELVPAGFFALFLVLAGWSLGHPLVASEPDWPSMDGDPFYSNPVQTGEPRLAWRGREYVKLNTPELLSLAERGAAPDLVAVRGVVLKAKGPDGVERTVLARAQIVCCLADALGVGFELSGQGFEGFEPGQWVRVLGHLEQTKPVLRTGDAPWPGVVIVVLGVDHVLAVEDVQRVDPPELPYVFDVRAEEPFEY